MLVTVQIKPNARVERVEPVIGAEGLVLHVSVKELPVEGRANEALLRVLAKYYGVAPSLVRIVSGAKSRKKIIEISN